MKTLLLVATLSATALSHPAAAQSLGGSPVAGVCLLSREALFANAKVGVAATARLRELTQQAETEIETDRKSVQADVASLQSQRASPKPAELAQRQQAIGQRQQALQAKAQLRTQELELTRQKALAQIGEQAQPVIAEAYKAKGCGLLFNRDAVLGGNMSGDLTAEVVKGLDARITTITFNREVIPAQTASNAR